MVSGSTWSNTPEDERQELAAEREKLEASEAARVASQRRYIDIARRTRDQGLEKLGKPPWAGEEEPAATLDVASLDAVLEALENVLEDLGTEMYMAKVTKVKLEKGDPAEGQPQREQQPQIRERGVGRGSKRRDAQQNGGCGKRRAR